jgi:hypothetical protein
MKQILMLAILSLVSCDNRYGVEFIVHNESQETIDSIRISTSDKKSTIKLVQLQKGLTKVAFLDMADVLRIDGDYKVEITSRGQTKINNVGYYTNGSPPDETYDIYFMADTIKFESKPR